MSKGIKRILAALFVAGLMCFAATTGYAAGFGLYEWDNRAMGMGGAVVGMPEGPEALSVNPAAIAWLDRVQAKVGVCVVNPSGKVKTTNMYDRATTTTAMDEKYHLIPHAYVSTPLFKQVYFGMGMFSRFGLAAEFEKSWPGRYNSYLAQIESFSVTPVFSFKINDQLAIAGGLEFMYFDLKLSQTIDATKYLYATGNTGLISAGIVPPTVNDPRTNLMDVNQKLEGDSKGYGYNISLSWMPKENLGFGLTYRSEVHQKVTGNSQYERSPMVRAIFGNNLFQFSDVTGTIDLPAQILVGVNYKPTEKWNLGVSAIHTMWSSYDSLTVEFQNPRAIGLPSKTSKKNWSDVWRLQFGVEYKALDWLALRASYVYDESPIDGSLADYLLPTSDRNIFGIGAGFMVTENLAIDVNYSYLMQKDRTVASRQIADGVLASEFEDGDANLFGVSFSYKF